MGGFAASARGVDYIEDDALVRLRASRHETDETNPCGWHPASGDVVLEVRFRPWPILAGLAIQPGLPRARLDDFAVAVDAVLERWMRPGITGLLHAQAHVLR